MSAEFPLRPLTFGEVLDAGVVVLRHRPWVLAVAGLLAALERAALHAGWAAYGVPLNGFSDVTGHFGRIWLFLAAGMGTEAFIISILDAFTADGAADLAAAGPVRLRRRWPSVLVTGVVTGAVASATFAAAGVLWLPWFMISALAIPTLVVDGGTPDHRGRLPNPVRLFGRSIRLAGRGWLAGRARLVAYLPWLLVRLLVSVAGGGAAVGTLLQITSGTAITVIDWVLWIALNALVYATIAGIDASSHLQTRIRTEGLDISIGRAARAGQPLESALAVPR